MHKVLLSSIPRIIFSLCNNFKSMCKFPMQIVFNVLTLHQAWTPCQWAWAHSETKECVQLDPFMDKEPGKKMTRWENVTYMEACGRCNEIKGIDHCLNKRPLGPLHDLGGSTRKPIVKCSHSKEGTWTLMSSLRGAQLGHHLIYIREFPRDWKPSDKPSKE